MTTGTGRPLDDTALDLLALGVAHGRSVFLAVADAAESDRWPEVVGGNQSLLARRAPALTLAPWYWLVTGAPADGALELRQALVRWAAAERARRTAAGRGRRSTRALAVGRYSADSGWERVLERAIGHHRQLAGQRLSIEVARIHLRCAREVTERGCARLPAVLDAELHGLAVLATGAVQAGTVDALTAVLGQVLERNPEPDVLRRVARVVRRQPEATADRVLMVISSGEVAEVAGAGALSGLAAYRPARGPGADPEVMPLFIPPFGLGLTAGCFPLWAADADPRRCRLWLQRALRAVEVALQEEVDRRFAGFHAVTAALTVRGVAEGVLPI